MPAGPIAEQSAFQRGRHTTLNISDPVIILQPLRPKGGSPVPGLHSMVYIWLLFQQDCRGSLHISRWSQGSSGTGSLSTLQRG